MNTDPQEDLDDEDCYNCGGEGFIEGWCECQSVEDVCCCASPTPPICETCGGSGAMKPTKPAAAFRAELERMK